MIAKDLKELHANPNISKQTGLTEKGEPVNGRGATRRTSTTSSPAAPPSAAMVGHHDRIGLRDDEPSRAWNASHPSRGCSMQALQSSGGAGLIYCFAAN